MPPPKVFSISYFNLIDHFERKTAGIDFVIRGIIIGVSRYQDPAPGRNQNKPLINIDIIDRDSSGVIRVLFYDREARIYGDRLVEGHAISLRNPTARPIDDFKDKAGKPLKPSLSKLFYLKFGDSTTCSIGTGKLPFDIEKVVVFYKRYHVEEIQSVEYKQIIGEYEI